MLSVYKQKWFGFDRLEFAVRIFGRLLFMRCELDTLLRTFFFDDTNRFLSTKRM